MNQIYEVRQYKFLMFCKFLIIYQNYVSKWMKNGKGKMKNLEFVSCK